MLAVSLRSAGRRVARSRNIFFSVFRCSAVFVSVAGPGYMGSDSGLHENFRKPLIGRKTVKTKYVTKWAMSAIFSGGLLVLLAALPARADIFCPTAIPIGAEDCAGVPLTCIGTAGADVIYGTNGEIRGQYTYFPDRASA